MREGKILNTTTQNSAELVTKINKLTVSSKTPFQKMLINKKPFPTAKLQHHFWPDSKRMFAQADSSWIRTDPQFYKSRKCIIKSVDVCTKML